MFTAENNMKIWHVASGGTFVRMTENILNKFMVLLQCELSYDPSGGIFWKYPGTVCTIVRLLSSVNPPMSFHIGLRREWQRTFRTSVWFFSSVSSHMILQVVFFWKCTGTVRTLLRFLSSVNPHMSFQIGLSSEWQRTFRTSVWFFFSVSSHMLCKGDSVGKSLFTF